MGVLDWVGDRRREGAVVGVNVKRPVVTNGILCMRGGDALFPNDFGEDLLTRTLRPSAATDLR